MKPQSMEEIQDIVRSRSRLRVRGAGTKPALSPVLDDESAIDMGDISGMLEYDPVEFTFTALAGTPVAQINEKLSTHGQFLPFDPPLVKQGATLGGSVAAGLSGAGRYRYGGVRDFLLGVRFVDGLGNLVRGGGKVVKNAAGFDLPKLVIGSLGQFGVLVELAFKVFPQPQSQVTLKFSYPSLGDALGQLIRLAGSPLEIFALELEPDQQNADLVVRLGGTRETLGARVERLEQFLGYSPAMRWDAPDAEFEVWEHRREFGWAPPEYLLVKVPLTPRRVPKLDELLAENSALRRYSAGASQAWVAWPENPQKLDQLLYELELSGLVLWGQVEKPLIGAQTGENFTRRVRQALDPQGKFS